MFKRLLRSEKGFTLVELMVVILIIAILVAIAVPVYQTVTANARTKACYSNQRTIDGAVNSFRADKDRTPTGISELVTEGYLKKNPEDPGNPGTTYSLTGDGTQVNGCPSGEHGSYQ